MAGINSEEKPVLGFDLGTTYSALSKWIDKKGPQIIQNSLGDNTTQSVVYHNPDNGEILVGKLAYKRGLQIPENMIVGVKRLMDDGHQKIRVGGKEFTPIEISAKILEKIYEDAKSKFPKGKFESRGSVVSVPFYFKADQISNTRKAADIAKINCVGIIQEPIAASLAYAFRLCDEHSDKEFGQNILVFDLGGGTFDLTLFRLEHRKKQLVFEVLATGGDDRLGGMDFDQCLAEVILKKSGVSLSELKMKDTKLYNQAYQKLIEGAIETKISLTPSPSTFTTIPFILPDKSIDIAITREEFEKSIGHYLKKIEGIIEGIWVKGGVHASDVDRIIRVGGSSLIPCVRALLDDIIGADKVWGNIDPSTAIAEGAAMYAACLDDKEFFDKDIKIIIRTCHALGIKTKGNTFKEIIPANLKTPCERKHLFTNVENNATTFDIEVYQGLGRNLTKETHSHIGTITISGLPSKPAGELDILVTFKMNNDQTLSVTVEAEGQRKVAPINFDGKK